MQPTIGRIVNFFPKTECFSNGPTKIEMYAAIVTQQNGDGTVDLATLGPNSLYFQHKVPEFGRKFPATDEHPEGAWAWGWSWPVLQQEQK